MGMDLERALWRMVAPHKVKLAVSGCPRNCAESGIKDVGVIGVDSGWEIYVGGNGGIKTEVAQFLCKVRTPAEVLSSSPARSCSCTAREGWYPERTMHYIARVGLDHVKARARRRGGPQGVVGTVCSSRSTASPDPWLEFDKRASMRASSNSSSFERRTCHARLEAGVPRRRDPAARRALRAPARPAPTWRCFAQPTTRSSRCSTTARTRAARCRRHRVRQRRLPLPTGR